MPVVMFAQSFMLSNIPLPKTYIQDLDPYECDESCMQDYLDKGMVFSFLSHASGKLESAEQTEARVLFVSIFNLGSFHSNQKLHIALLLPYKTIGKYASSTTNAVFAYLMTKGHPFTLKSYKVDSEESMALQTALEKISADGFEYVIAPLTKKGAQNVISLNPALHIYFPTINKQDVASYSPYLSYGGIDYKAQIHLLLKEALSPLVIFSDKSTTGKMLAAYQKEEFKHPTAEITSDQDANTGSSFLDDTLHVFSEKKKPIVDKKVINYFISRRTTNLEPYLKENEKIVHGSFVINTPIIKSGMIMSQLTLYDTNATNILSTQINYNPLLLSMTQYIDRKDMIVANSITQKNSVLIETNSLLGNDIVYDWINYTTTIGADYFYSLITDEDRIYTAKMQDNQMVYDIELLQPSHSKFVKYVRPNRD